jgi:hypothetical protein
MKGTVVPTFMPTPSPTLTPTHREADGGHAVKDLDDDKDDDAQKMKQEFDSKGKVRYDAPVHTELIVMTATPTISPTGTPTIAPTSPFFKSYIPGLDNPNIGSSCKSWCDSGCCPLNGDILKVSLILCAAMITV